ncbi:serine carboxypeptidase 1-like [Salvia miltiorrhiza]|uniref:serine carboxypeptidase 1-like n=1 Tax=Salvia miltiorrhiza TaxID=226208 RepID=UPI0025AD5748|nr:serine carboxypeptidase 1-like [Salvia miltiorrhiza]
MKVVCVVLVCFVCVTVLAGGSTNPLNELLKAGRTKASIDHVDTLRNYAPVYVGIQHGLRDADKISSLPGQPQVNFSQYSGYVTIDPVAGRALFYYFTQSEHPSDKPLVLWLNGGPGCSSLGSGAMTELGPFRVNPDGKTMWHNENAWNKGANVIFLESPAGVGFSYSNRSSDYLTGDEQTAADTYTFLLNWLERFPDYKNRDFYITGESYAGHYVPQLAALILKNNNQTPINLKGIAIGNAYIDDGDNSRGMYEFYWTHALISDEIHRGIAENCNFSSAVTNICRNYTNQADESIGNVFAYDIYAPLCSSSSSLYTSISSQDNPRVSDYDPCSDDYVYAYLNRADVQKALHANSTGNIPGPWNSCSDVVQYDAKDIKATVIPTIIGLMGSGIRVWLFSGDTDSVVAVTATRYSLDKIGAAVKTPWYPWFSQGQVGGYAVEYENITFVTVRGAGHFVPSYQPHRALTLFSSFIEGKLPPNHI